MNSNLPLDATDIKILKEYFDLKRVDEFENIIHKREKKGAFYYSFPFYGENGKIANYRNFHLNYDTRDGSDEPSFWYMNHQEFKYYDILLLSDHPLKLLNYFSSNFHKFKQINLLGIVPYHFNSSSLLKIASKFEVYETRTIFQSSNKKELLKLFTSAAFAGQKIKFKTLPSSFKLNNGKKEIEVEEIKYYELKRYFGIHNNTKIKMRHL